MSETAFPVNDLLRRPLQTGLTILSLTTCVASTLFVLVFAGQVGYGFAEVSTQTLTSGVSAIFGQFLLFVGTLIFVVGAVIVSFIVFLMMAQRTKDFGLMKATGCPNNLVFGYFLTELLGITFIGCFLGVVIGFATDYIVINISTFQVYNSTPNFLFAPLVFAVYFGFALIFGAKPLFDTARMSPIKALSPVQYFGLGETKRDKPLSKTGLTLRIASRSLFRRKSVTVRIVVFLSTVFLLLTISIAGGIIANDTSTSWVDQAIGKNTILIAHKDMANQYVQLIQTFSGVQENANFDYSNQTLVIPESTLDALANISEIEVLDTRIVWKTTIHEVPGFMIDPSTLTTLTVGANRQCESLIIGIDAKNTVAQPFTTGNFLDSASVFNAVVGDSIAKAIYSPFAVRQGFREQTILSDPLYESVKIANVTFRIAGACLDPINNGNVTYVPLEKLQDLTGLRPNIVLIRLDPDADNSAILKQIEGIIQQENPNIAIINMNPMLEKNVSFLRSLWNVIMFLPAFALAAASISMISFMMLTIEEQCYEFGVIRATGAKPRTVTTILAFQSLTVILASLGIGTAFGTIISVLILITDPVVSTLTVVSIAGWLIAALLGMFLLSLFPAVKFAKKSLREIVL